METIRNRLIHHGASVTMVNGILTLRLNASFAYQKEVVEILTKLRQQVNIEHFKDLDNEKSTAR